MVEQIGRFGDQPAAVFGDGGDRDFHRFLAELLGAMRHTLVDQGARVRRAGFRLGPSLHALFQVVNGEWLHARSLAPLPAAGERPHA